MYNFTPVLAVDMVADLLVGSDNLFIGIMTPCKVVAVFGIAIQLYAMVPKFADIEELPYNVNKLFWCMLLAVIINGNGIMAKNIAILNWAVIKGINTAIEVNIDRVLDLTKLKGDYVGDVETAQAIEAKLKACNSINVVLPDNTPNPAYTACQNDLKNFISISVSSGKIRDPNMLDNFNQILTSWTSNGINFGQIGDGITKAIGSYFSDFLSPILKVIFAGWRAIINNIAEQAVLLAILSLPIPLALSVMNIGPLTVWFSALWAVGIFQFNLTILTKSFEYFNVKFGASLSNYFLDIAICFFAPAIAGLMATGGAIGVFKATVAATGQIGSLALKIPMAAQKAGLAKKLG
jgi:hypothetical protein